MSFGALSMSVVHSALSLHGLFAKLELFPVRLGRSRQGQTAKENQGGQMFRRINVWRGLTTVGTLLLSIAIIAGLVLEMYKTSADAFFGTRSQQTITNISEDDGGTWTYQSEFATAKEAYEGLKEFALEEDGETNVLLKNDDDVLPIAKDVKIAMFGIRSYAPVYGSSGGSITDGYFDC